MLYCPPFSTVYNIFLCLHIFSVHITHQNKKRNYENLDQLSYDNKRGPKVYLHGQCTPPTNFPNVAARNQPKPVTSRPRNAPLLVARVLLVFTFRHFPMVSMKNGFCYEKLWFSVIPEKKRWEERPAFMIFIFSFSQGVHVLRTHTLTQRQFASSFLCGDPVVWDSDFLPFRSTSLVLSSFFIFYFSLRGNAPLSPLHLFLVTGCIDLLLPPLPNTCTFFFGALIILSLHANKCKSLFSPPWSFFFF